MVLGRLKLRVVLHWRRFEGALKAAVNGRNFKMLNVQDVFMKEYDTCPSWM